MADNELLPFPRGSTYSDWATSVTAGSGKNLTGRVFKTNDTEHGTGTTVLLRVVCNDSGAAITTAKKCVGFGTATNDFGRMAKAIASVGQGGEVKPMDDAMTASKSIAANDLFYCVEEGPCNIVNTSDTALSIAAHGHVCCAAGGTLDKAVADDEDYVIGIADEAQASGDVDANALIWVQRGFAREGS